MGPKEKRDLLLEFHPQEAVAYCIYLPYILNGILGPPELNCINSLIGDYYLNSKCNKFKTVKDSSIRKLKGLKILCAASKAWFKFSSLKLEFNWLQKLCQAFEVKNVSENVHEVQ